MDNSEDTHKSMTEEEVQVKANNDFYEQQSDDNIDNEEVQNNDLEVQLGEAKDKYLRLFAEFDNYKKRTAKERIQMIQTASQDLVKDLLVILDDFERALENSQRSEEVSAITEGYQLIYSKFLGILKQRGLQELDSTGGDFDPEIHEAITEIPAPAEGLKGKIVDTIEKGYQLNDKIIRHAKVVIGK